MSARRILIVLHGAIGDVTRALPLVMRIKRSWPDARISWGVEPISSALVAAHPAVDRVVIFQRKAGLAGYRRYIAELRSEPYDIVLDMQRHLKSGFTSFLSGGKVRLGFHWRNAKEFNWLWNNRQIEYAEHFSSKLEHYQKFGDALGLAPIEPLEFGLGVSDASRSKVTALLAEQFQEKGISPDATLVAFIIGSSCPSRLWPAQRYHDLTRELSALGIVPLLVGGAGEEAFAAEIQAGAGAPVLNLCGKTSLADLPGVFERVAWAVGSDSGPMHIAAACGKKVISMWGSTSPLRSAPFGSEELVLQSAIGCSPCFLKNCPGLGTLCMRDIPHAAVLARAETLIDGRNR